MQSTLVLTGKSRVSKRTINQIMKFWTDYENNIITSGVAILRYADIKNATCNKTDRSGRKVLI